MKCVSVFAYLCMQICVYVFVILFLLLPNGGREGVADQLSLLLWRTQVNVAPLEGVVFSSWLLLLVVLVADVGGAVE